RVSAGAEPEAGGPLISRSLLPVLVGLHQETSTPGRIGNALRALGHPLDIRRPRLGDALPETLEFHAGAVIFGGPMSANDPDDFIRREIAGSPSRLPSSVHSWASASARRCWRSNSVPALRRIRKAARRSAITRSVPPPPE